MLTLQLRPGSAQLLQDVAHLRQLCILGVQPAVGLPGVALQPEVDADLLEGHPEQAGEEVADDYSVRPVEQVV